jgi:hypothetical protein
LLLYTPPACLCVCCFFVGLVQWRAPEVCTCSSEAGTVATTASDVYMVGGFLYELLTSGTPPFHWLMDNVPLLSLRRVSRVPVPIPGARGVTIPGLHGKSVLEVAEEDGEPIPWRVRVDGSPGSVIRLEAVKALLVQCLAAEPGARPKVLALLATVDDLLVAESGEVRAAGVSPASGGGVEEVVRKREAEEAHRQAAEAEAAWGRPVEEAARKRTTEEEEEEAAKWAAEGIRVRLFVCGCLWRTDHLPITSPDSTFRTPHPFVDP